MASHEANVGIVTCTARYQVPARPISGERLERIMRGVRDIPQVLRGRCAVFLTADR